MYEIGDARFTRKGAQPGKQFWRIGMVAELLKCRDLRPNLNQIAEDLHLFRAAFDDEATRARSLKANEENGILRIGKALCQMVQNAAAGRHPTRRNDDDGIAHLI